MESAAASDKRPTHLSGGGEIISIVRQFPSSSSSHTPSLSCTSTLSPPLFSFFFLLLVLFSLSSSRCEWRFFNFSLASLSLPCLPFLSVPSPLVSPRLSAPPFSCRPCVRWLFSSWPRRASRSVLPPRVQAPHPEPARSKASTANGEGADGARRSRSIVFVFCVSRVPERRRRASALPFLSLSSVLFLAIAAAYAAQPFYSLVLALCS